MTSKLRSTMRRHLVYAAVALAPAVPAARISAQSGPPRADSVLATLVTPNGEMRLTLTGRALRVGFTGLGQRRIRHAADSAFAASPAAKGARPGRTRSGRADDASPPPDQARRDAQDEEEKPDKPLPLRDVEAVRASGDSLLLCFASHPGPGPAAPPCSLWRRLLVTGLPPGDAQRFAEAVRRARATRLGSPD